eukprot:m.262189 g.262189  ORF g.262189 m.262189 type:complete len:110 (+) comp54618_c0_seq2:317-646(+)
MSVRTSAFSVVICLFIFSAECTMLSICLARDSSVPSLGSAMRPSDSLSRTYVGWRRISLGFGSDSVDGELTVGSVYLLVNCGGAAEGFLGPPDSASRACTGFRATASVR